MDTPTLAPILLSSLPAEVVALLTTQARRIAELEALVAELQRRLGQNSSNSSKPPSSDGPHVKPAPPKIPSGKRRGGQPGHTRHERTRHEPTRVLDVKPCSCGRCGPALAGDDPDPAWRQVVELPPVRPDLTEYREEKGSGSFSCPSIGRNGTRSFFCTTFFLDTPDWRT